MTQQEEFEAWFCKAHSPASLRPMAMGYYLNLGAGMAWDAWQAALSQPAKPVEPLEITPAMAKAADAWLDCGSKLILNKAAAALKAGIANAKERT